MSNDISLSAIKEKIRTYLPKLTRHLSFAVIIFILLVFLFIVWRISQLASADPTPEEESTAEVSSVPKVDQNAINQVLKLENKSKQVHAIFNAARKNPFGE